MPPVLQKTWRKDSLSLPMDVSLSQKETNSWALWAIKELMCTGNDGSKGGPGSWSVIGSCNKSEQGMDAVDRWVDYKDVIGTSGSHSWIVLRQTALGAGSGLEVCFDFTDDSSYYDELTIVYSWSAGFSGGSTSTRPTATDENEVCNRSTTWIGGTNSWSNYQINRIMSTDGEITRVFGLVDAAPRGCLCLEKMANPAAWLDENFIAVTQANEIAASEVSWGTGYYKCRINGVNCNALLTSPGYWSGTHYSFFGSVGRAKVPDEFGNWPMFNTSAISVSQPNEGRIGDMVDMFAIYGGMPNGYLLPDSVAEGKLIVFSDWAWGNDGERFVM